MTAHTFHTSTDQENQSPALPARQGRALPVPIRHPWYSPGRAPARSCASAFLFNAWIAIGECCDGVERSPVGAPSGRLPRCTPRISHVGFPRTTRHQRSQPAPAPYTPYESGVVPDGSFFSPERHRRCWRTPIQSPTTRHMRLWAELQKGSDMVQVLRSAATARSAPGNAAP